jgi:hypothetical protein
MLGPEAMVPIRAFHSLVEAELARALLEGNGLEVQLEDHHTVGAAGHLAQTIGGVKVLVKNEDVELAEELLKAQKGTALLEGGAASRPVFRIRSSRAAVGLGVGAGAGLALGLALAAMGLARFSGLAFLTLALFGFARGKKTPRYFCSDISCIQSFPEGVDHCPTCQKSFSGTLDHMDQRLEAEEKLRLGSPEQAVQQR